MKYHHIGIPTDIPREDERYLEKFKNFMSGYGKNMYGIEWMRFESNCPLPEIVKTIPHVAFEVENLNEAIKGKEILIEPNSPSEGVMVTFILDNGAPVELLEINKSAK